MLNVDGVYAWIEVDGRPVNEFNVVQSKQENGSIHVSCHIPSEAGKDFSIIVWSRSEGTLPDDGLKFAPVLDGVESGWWKHVWHGKKATLDSWRVSPTEKRRLKFNILERTEDSDVYDGRTRLGTIGLRVLSVTYGKRVPMKKKDFPTLPESAVNEKVKKSIPHCVGLGATVHKELATTKLKVKAVKKSVLFTFNYASMDWLQASGLIKNQNQLIPRTIIAKRSMSEVTLTPGPSSKRIKREPTIDVDSQPLIRVKRERPAVKVKPEVIDLTSD